MENGGCENCVHHITLRKHPWNQDEKIKGPVSEDTGYHACIVDHAIDEKNRKGYISDRIGNGCELFLHINHKEHDVIDKYKL
jgi:hypothetical protein